VICRPLNCQTTSAQLSCFIRQPQADELVLSPLPVYVWPAEICKAEGHLVVLLHRQLQADKVALHGMLQSGNKGNMTPP